MNIKSIIGLIFSLIAVLGINFIPLEMWLNRNFSGEYAMIIYALENVFAIIFAIIFVLLFAPKTEQTDKVRSRWEVLQAYSVVAIGFTVACGIFIGIFTFLILKVQINFSAIQTAMLWIVGFQILEFVGDILMLRPFSLKKAEFFLTRSLGRVFLLFLAVFIGFFLAAFVDKWFVVPFIILKTISDIGSQIQIFTGLGKKENEANFFDQKRGKMYSQKFKVK